MNYTIHQLRVFITVYNTKSVTKAAEVLHLTQPAVSMQLKKLQDQFEIPLTEVIGRKLYITPFGEEIAKIIQSILEKMKQIKEQVELSKGLLSGKIRIASVSTGKYLMPYFLKAFMKLHPQIEIIIDVTNKNKVVEDLRKNSTDFALVSVIPTDLDLIRIQLLQNHLYLVGSKEVYYTISQLKGSFAAKMQSLKFIFREPGSATRRAMEHFLETENMQVQNKIELKSNEAVKQAVAAGLGVSVMPLIGLKNELQLDQIKIIEHDQLPIESNWNLVYLKGKEMTPAMNAFIGHLSLFKQGIIEKQFSWILNYI